MSENIAMKKYILPIAVCILCAFLSACDTPGWMTDIFEAKTVTFDSRGGSPVPTQTLLFGERAKKPDDPTKPECVFTGWFEKNGSLYNFDSIPMTNITLYADWSEKDIVIEAADVTLSHIPSTGQSTATTAAAGGTGYTCGEVSWYPSGGVFSALTVYTATVTLTAAAGRSFSDPITVTFNELSVTPVSRSGKSITVSRSFPATSKAVVTAVAVRTQPSKLTYAYGDSLDLSGLVVTLSYDDGSFEDVPYAQFSVKGVTETPANGARLTISGNNGRGVEVSVSDSVKTSTSNLMVNKAAGSAVTNPVAAGNPSTSTINVTTPSTLSTATGQSIEYAISTSDAAAPASLAWKADTTFTVVADSIALNTPYYVYARSAADGNYEAGTPNRSLDAVGVYQGSVNIITITLAQITDAAPTITVPTLSRTGQDGKLKSITLDVSGNGFTNVQWKITGTGLTGSGLTGTGDTFTLNATDDRYNQIGDHHLTLIVYKDGVPYNKTIIFTIVE